MVNNITNTNEQCDYKVFSNDTSRGNECHNTVIICYLYYSDTLDTYFKYIDSIPDEIDTYLLTSRSDVAERLNERYGHKSNTTIVEKDNRGRELTGLLIECSDFIFDYELVCFVHDKKEIHDAYRIDTKKWALSLWENTIGTADYIRNVCNYFHSSENIGLLVPPEPLGENLDYWYSDNWGANYLNTVKLARDIGLRTDISHDVSPISIGSVFWARTIALKKLFEKRWSYSDFSEEPMPEDGTISHAIERLLSYVVLDAGYKTEKILSSDYAANEMGFLQAKARIVADLLRDTFGIKNIKELEELVEQKREIDKLIEDYRSVYLYGAGKNGRYLAGVLRRFGIEPAGFVVSELDEDSLVDGIRVFSMPEVESALTDSGIIITPKKDSVRKEIEKLLENKGISHYMYLD